MILCSLCLRNKLIKKPSRFEYKDVGFDCPWDKYATETKLAQLFCVCSMTT